MVTSLWKTRRGAQRAAQDAEPDSSEKQERAQCLSVVPYDFGEVIEMKVLQLVQKPFTHIIPWEQGDADIVSPNTLMQLFCFVIR